MFLFTKRGVGMEEGRDEGERGVGMGAKPKSNIG